jgi:riboflavin kinase / FMN adenylyltransferase
MKVTPLFEVEPRPRQVAVGTFDGVHLGHREVIRGSDTVLTFDPHPLQVVHP